MLKILNLIKSIICELLVVENCFWGEFHNEIGFLFKIIQTVEFDNCLALWNGKPLPSDVVLEHERR